MKKQKYINLIVTTLLVILMIACSKSDEFDAAIDPENIDWQANTGISITAIDSITSFIWETNLLTMESYPVSDTLELSFKIESTEKIENISKVEIYVSAEEKEGYNYSEPFDYTRKLFATITEIPEDGKFSLKIPAEDLYELFRSDFLNDRSEVHLLDGDFFTLTWQITHLDGTVFDSNDNPIPENNFGLQVKYQDYLPPVFEGTYTYEYLEVGPGMAMLGIDVGRTGVIEISLTEPPGTYYVSDVNFSSWFLPNTLTHDFFSGLVTVEEGFYITTWAILDVNGASIDIYWQNNFTVAYGFWGVVRITKDDGVAFPDNIYTNETRP